MLENRSEANDLAKWTNRSVIALADDRDPIAEVTSRARSLVLNAMEEGWAGPPYDPFSLADILGIPTVASDDVPDARVGYQSGRFFVEYNPNRQRSRIGDSPSQRLSNTVLDLGPCLRLTPDFFTPTQTRDLGT